jgi:hypothetical protein
MSQALTSLILRTGNAKQAFASLIQSMLQGLIQLGLQLAISALLSGLLGQEAAASQTGPGATAYSAWEPAAIAADTATFGGASAAALLSLGAAIAAGRALGFVGAQSGGYTGEGPEDQIGGFFHRREFVFSAPRVRAIGRDVLEALHRGIPFAQPRSGGGFAGPGSGGIPVDRSDDGRQPIQIFMFHDIHKAISAYNRSSAARKEFVDTARKNSIGIGIRR